MQQRHRVNHSAAAIFVFLSFVVVQLSAKPTEGSAGEQAQGSGFAVRERQPQHTCLWGLAISFQAFFGMHWVY